MKRTFVVRDNSVLTRLLVFLSSWDHDPKNPITVTVTDTPRPRTLEQNDRYWTTIWNLCKATGHSKDEMHTIVFDASPLRPQHVEWKGQTLVVIPSTTRLSVKDMSDLIDTANMMAAELGVPEEIIDAA